MKKNLSASEKKFITELETDFGDNIYDVIENLFDPSGNLIEPEEIKQKCESITITSCAIVESVPETIGDMLCDFLSSLVSITNHALLCIEYIEGKPDNKKLSDLVNELNSYKESAFDELHGVMSEYGIH